MSKHRRRHYRGTMGGLVRFPGLGFLPKVPSSVRPVDVAVGAGLAYAGYRFYKNYQANAAANPATTAATTPATDTSGGAGSSAATPTDLTPIEDLAQALNGYTAVLGAGGSTGIGSTAAWPATVSQ